MIGRTFVQAQSVGNLQEIHQDSRHRLHTRSDLKRFSLRRMRRVEQLSNQSNL